MVKGTYNRRPFVARPARGSAWLAMRGPYGGLTRWDPIGTIRAPDECTIRNKRCVRQGKSAMASWTVERAVRLQSG